MQIVDAPNVRWGEWIGEGWNMFAQRWQVWVLQTLIFFVILVVPMVPIYVMSAAAEITAAQTGARPEPPAALVPLVLLMVLLFFLVVPFLWGGLWHTAFKQMRGEPVSVGDLFSGGSVFLRLIGAFIVLGILSILGVLLCFFPALIVYGMFYFTIPLIVERKMDIGDALSASFNATKKHWFMFTLFALVVYLISAAGQFACYVGALVTFPLQFTIMAIAYRDIFGVPGGRSFISLPVSSTTSYAGQAWPAPSQPPPPSAPGPFAQAPLFAPPPPDPPPSVTEDETSRLDQQEPAFNCPHCGTALRRTAIFCNFCGNRLQT